MGSQLFATCQAIHTKPKAKGVTDGATPISYSRASILAVSRATITRIRLSGEI